MKTTTSKIHWALINRLNKHQNFSEFITFSLWTHARVDTKKKRKHKAFAAVKTKEITFRNTFYIDKRLCEKLLSHITVVAEVDCEVLVTKSLSPVTIPPPPFPNFDIYFHYSVLIASFRIPPPNFDIICHYSPLFATFRISPLPPPPNLTLFSTVCYCSTLFAFPANFGIICHYSLLVYTTQVNSTFRAR